MRPTSIRTLNFFIGGSQEDFPDDSDCTSVCYHALLKTNAVTEQEVSRIARITYENVNDDGLLLTYYVTKDHRRYNRLDAINMINVIRFAYAQRHEKFTQRSEDYVFDWLNSGHYKSGTLYYPSPYAFLYFCAKLTSTNYSTKMRFTDTLRREFSQINTESLKYPLDYAFVILTGVGLGVDNEVLVEKLLGMQNEDGSWPADALYYTNGLKMYCGSTSISTIFSVLALIETI